MKVALKVICPGCQHPNQVRITRPTRFRSPRFMYTCEDCKSVIRAWASHPKGETPPPPGTVNVNQTVAIPGPELADHLAKQSS